LKERLDTLKTERAILTIERRKGLARSAKELLPEAIRQTKPGGKRTKGKPRQPGPRSAA
jgi:hypothetical protein